MLVLVRRFTTKRDDDGDTETGGAAAGEFSYVRKDSIRDRLLSSDKDNFG